MLYILNRNRLTPLALSWYNLLPIELLLSPRSMGNIIKKIQDWCKWFIMKDSTITKKKRATYTFFGHIYSCLWASCSQSAWYRYLQVIEIISDEPTKSKHESQTIFFKKRIPNQFDIVHNCLSLSWTIGWFQTLFMFLLFWLSKDDRESKVQF